MNQQLLQSLKNAKGGGTSVITLLLPANTNI